MRKHLFGAVLTGLALRLYLVWRFPLISGDTAIYDQFARNWLDHGVYGLWLAGKLVPVDMRVPGYPAFIAAIYSVFGRSLFTVMVAQAFLDTLTCLLAGAIAGWLAPEGSRTRVAAAAVWLAALCPFVANYCATPLTEILATFLTTAAILVMLVAAGPSIFSYSRGDRYVTFSSRALYFAAGFLIGLATLVRPESPLLLISTGLVLLAHGLFSTGRRSLVAGRLTELIRIGLLMGAGLALALLPWAARNYVTLHKVQFLNPRHAELPGEVVPRGFYAWTNTWLVRYRDVYLAPWKIDMEPIYIDDINPAAFDAPAERARVAALLDRYNEDSTYTPELDAEFAALARERTSHHPMRTYLWIPFERALTLWFTPRVELLPYSGHLFPIAEMWEDDPVDFSVTVFLGFLNFLFVGLALTGAWKLWRSTAVDSSPVHTDGARLGLWLIIAFVIVRTVFLTRVETPEPRYVVVCFPALLALAAQLWSRR